MDSSVTCNWLLRAPVFRRRTSISFRKKKLVPRKRPAKKNHAVPEPHSNTNQHQVSTPLKGAGEDCRDSVRKEKRQCLMPVMNVTPSTHKIVSETHATTTATAPVTTGWENTTTPASSDPTTPISSSLCHKESTQTLVKAGFVPSLQPAPIPACSNRRPFEIGQCIEAQFAGKPKWYTGRIAAALQNGNFNIIYDDGDREEDVEPHMIRVLQPRRRKAIQREFHMGQSVEGRYQGKKFWYTGRISSIRANGRYDIDYDDGDKEFDVPVRLIRKLERRRRKRARPLWFILSGSVSFKKSHNNNNRLVTVVQLHKMYKGYYQICT